MENRISKIRVRNLSLVHKKKGLCPHFFSFPRLLFVQRKNKQIRKKGEKNLKLSAPAVCSAPLV